MSWISDVASIRCRHTCSYLGCFSDQVCSEIEHQKEQLERASQKKGETAWHFLEIIDRALMELKSEQKK